MTYPLPEKAIKTFIEKVTFNEKGLVAAIAQQRDSREVLMMAWMNEAAIQETLTTGRVCYFSRSRNKLWRKGETSGQVQTLEKMRLDCDGDTLLLLVDQTGVACHTGRRNCFFQEAGPDGVEIIADVTRDPKELYPK